MTHLQVNDVSNNKLSINDIEKGSLYWINKILNDFFVISSIKILVIVSVCGLFG